MSYDNLDTVKMKAVFVKQKLGRTSHNDESTAGTTVRYFLGGGEPHETNMHRCDRALLFHLPADAKDSKRSLVATGFKALHSSVREAYSGSYRIDWER